MKNDRVSGGKLTVRGATGSLRSTTARRFLFSRGCRRAIPEIGVPSILTARNINPEVDLTRVAQTQSHLRFAETGVRCQKRRRGGGVIEK